MDNLGHSAKKGVLITYRECSKGYWMLGQSSSSLLTVFHSFETT